LETLLNRQPPGFFKFISFSAVLHVVIVALALFMVRGEPERIFYAPTFTPVELVLPPPPKRQAVEMPLPAKEEPAPAKPEPVVKEAAKVAPPAKPVQAKKAPPVPDVDAIALKKAPEVVEKKVSVEDAIAALEKKAKVKEAEEELAAKIDEIARKKDADARRKERELAELKKDIARGKTARRVVTIDAPASMSFSRPSQGYASDMEFRQYYSAIASRVESSWIYAGDELDRLDAIVSIKIDRKGTLLDYWIEKSSGDKAFDDSALKAVKKSAPFPPLPGGFQQDVLEVGMRF
jgi:TonB family protein